MRWAILSYSRRIGISAPEIDSPQSTHNAESSSIDDGAPQTQPPEFLGLNSMPQPSTPQDDFKPPTDRSHPLVPDKASHAIRLMLSAVWGITSPREYQVRAIFYLVFFFYEFE